VLSGALSGTEELFHTFGLNPSDYVDNTTQFLADYHTCLPDRPDGGVQVTPGSDCTVTPAGDGSFNQSVRRLGLYAQDSWRVTPHLTVNYGLRYDTTFGLFNGSRRTQLQNPAFITLQVLQIPLINGAPHDYHKQFGPRLGIAYSPGRGEKTVIRAGVGLYYNDLATKRLGRRIPGRECSAGTMHRPDQRPGSPQSRQCWLHFRCIEGGQAAIIDPHYHTPYAVHASAGVQHALNEHWTLSADWTHETGMHAYRGYSYAGGTDIMTPLPLPDGTLQEDVVPNVDVYRSDNRSNYTRMTIKVQGNMRWVNMTAPLHPRNCEDLGLFRWRTVRLRERSLRP